MQIDEIQKVLIAGAGTLGLRIGLQFAISEYDTFIYDHDDKALDKGAKTATKILDWLISKGRVDEASKTTILSRLTWTTDLQAATKDVDFVSESIIEDLDAKISFWSQLVPMLPKGCAMTTNTSYLLPSMIAEHIGHPSNFCAFHFHDVFWANVVDIMPHPGTAGWMIDLLKTLGVKLEQTPVELETEHPGYIFNYMLMAVLGSAGALVTGEVASIQDVDRSWMGNFKMPRGPFGILDEVGLDTAWRIVSVRKDEKSRRFANLLKEHIDRGELGVKTGKGFYSYPNPEFKNPEFLIS